MTAFWVWFPLPHTVDPFNLVPTVETKTYVDIIPGFAAQVTAALGDAACFNRILIAAIFFHFDIFVPVFTIKIQFCKITFEVIMELVQSQEIAFGGAYCSKCFYLVRCWFCPWLQFRLKIPKVRSPKWQSGASNLLAETTCYSPETSACRLTFPYPWRYEGFKIYKQAFFLSMTFSLCVSIAAHDCLIRSYCRESGLHWDDCSVWAITRGQKKTLCIQCLFQVNRQYAETIVSFTARAQSLMPWIGAALLWNIWKEARHSRYTPPSGSPARHIYPLQVIISQKCPQFKSDTDAW